MNEKTKGWIAVFSSLTASALVWVLLMSLPDGGERSRRDRDLSRIEEIGDINLDGFNDAITVTESGRTNLMYGLGTNTKTYVSGKEMDKLYLTNITNWKKIEANFRKGIK